MGYGRAQEDCTGSKGCNGSKVFYGATQKEILPCFSLTTRFTSLSIRELLGRIEIVLLLGNVSLYSRGAQNTTSYWCSSSLSPGHKLPKTSTKGCCKRAPDHKCTRDKQKTTNILHWVRQFTSVKYIFGLVLKDQGHILFPHSRWRKILLLLWHQRKTIHASLLEPGSSDPLGSQAALCVGST